MSTNQYEPTPAFVGLDLETTGLDPAREIILELGIVVFDQRLKPLHVASWVTASKKQVEERMDGMDARVRSMHWESGLFADVYQGFGVSPATGEKQACELLGEKGASGLPMLGSSITFDRGFLDFHMQKLHKKFHYRSLDSTSVRMACESIYGELKHVNDAVSSRVARARVDLEELGIAPDGLSDKHMGQHRVLGDIFSSAALAQLSIAYCVEEDRREHAQR